MCKVLCLNVAYSQPHRYLYIWPWLSLIIYQFQQLKLQLLFRYISRLYPVTTFFQTIQYVPFAGHTCCLLQLNLCFSYHGHEMCNLMKNLSYRMHHYDWTRKLYWKNMYIFHMMALKERKSCMFHIMVLKGRFLCVIRACISR